MANNPWDYHERDRQYRYGRDEDYERNMRRSREARGPRDPVSEYESLPVLGMDFGPGRGRPQYHRDDERSHDRGERNWWDRTQDEVRSWMGDAQAEHRRQMDHRGRGPRGYTRSDDRIREDVSDWLMEDRYVDASEIDVTVSGGEVTLAGNVESRDMKRRAEDLASRVLGVKDVSNRLRVGSSGARSTETSTSTSASATPRH